MTDSRNSHLGNSRDPNEIVLTAYFAGTSYTIWNQATVAGQLALHTFNDEKSHGQIAMAFDGCGVVYSFRGGFFGAGLHGQVRTVAAKVRELIQQKKKVTLNVYGHSRGAIAAELLALELSDISALPHIRGHFNHK